MCELTREISILCLASLLTITSPALPLSALSSAAPCSHPVSRVLLHPGALHCPRALGSPQLCQPSASLALPVIQQNARFPPCWPLLPQPHRAHEARDDMAHTERLDPFIQLTGQPSPGLSYWLFTVLRPLDPKGTTSTMQQMCASVSLQRPWESVIG